MKLKNINKSIKKQEGRARGVISIIDMTVRTIISVATPFLTDNRILRACAGFLFFTVVAEASWAVYKSKSKPLV